MTPQLRNFYEGIEKELYNGLNLDYIQDYCIDYLAERGVLMLNSSLTVEKDKKDNHTGLWRSFIEYLLKNVISPKIPIILIGNHAESFSKLIRINYTYILPDLGGVGKEWKTKDTFGDVNLQIESMDQDSIMWLNIEVPF